ncbi:MAG: preprotein translocase subunit SecG [Spirochaetaceae bacterium 4572_59]|nr:MAG: preprotein translocase subunit SecG [Spirochaetaceae bacterium 4572_59]
MGIIGTLLIVLFVIVCALLILFVLLQDDQGEGLGGLFGGSSGSPFGGATSNVLVRITSVLGTLFMVCSLLVAFVVKSPNSSDVLSEARQMNAENRNGQNWWQVDTAPGSGEGESLIIPQD